MVTIQLLGGACVRSGDAVIAGPPAQRHRIALLAMVVAAWPQPLRRNKAMALLWPEKDLAAARRLLNLAVHVLRSALGEGVIVSAGEGLLLNPSRVSCDLHDLRSAIAAGDVDRIGALSTAPLLDGFHLDDSVEFGYWLDERRAELAQAQVAALRAVAERQERAGDAHGRVATCRRLVAADPHSASDAVALMRALDAAGDRPAAIQHAAEHARRVRADLELEPDSQVKSFAEHLRVAPPVRHVFTPSDSSMPSVAVLPFIELGAPADDWFADGITQDVIAHLSKLRALRVISRTSVMQFRDRPGTLQDIGAALGATSLLEGSVRRIGDRVRIIATLVDVRADQQLWAETYDRQLTDIFAIQTDVALHIASALEAEISRNERERVRRPPTHDITAYQLLLQGRQWHIRYTAEGFRHAADRLERALIRDPGFALAAANLAIVLLETTENGSMTPSVAFPRAAAAVATALASDPELGEAHCASGFLLMMSDFDWAGAEREFARALELSPGSADVYDYYGRLLNGLGRWDEAIAVTRRAQELDPLAHRNDLASTLLRAGRLAEARVQAEAALELEPEYDRARGTLAWSHILSGHMTDGLRELERALRITPGSTLWLAQLGQAHAMAGDEARAREILATLEARARDDYVSPYHFAYVHTGLGEHDRAIDLLDSALRERHGPLYAIRGSFLFAPLRGHPRFQALLGRMGLE